MAMISIDVPDDLFGELLQHPELELSTIAENAFRIALDISANARWATRVSSRPVGTRGDLNAASIIEAARGDFGN